MYYYIPKSSSLATIYQPTLGIGDAPGSVNRRRGDKEQNRERERPEECTRSCLVAALLLCGAGWHPARRLPNGALRFCCKRSSGLPTRRRLPTCPTHSEHEFAVMESVR
jgi:hypothetical protein